MRKVKWDQIEVRRKDLAYRLTQWNFQPGKFVIVPSGLGWVTVVYVESEGASNATER